MRDNCINCEDGKCILMENPTCEEDNCAFYSRNCEQELEKLREELKETSDRAVSYLESFNKMTEMYDGRNKVIEDLKSDIKGLKAEIEELNLIIGEKNRRINFLESISKDARSMDKLIKIILKGLED